MSAATLLPRAPVMTAQRTPLDALLPGRRAALLRRTAAGAQTELLGYVTRADSDFVEVEDVRGLRHLVPANEVAAARTLGVSLGRDPMRADPAELDRLAGGQGIHARLVVRIASLLDGREPPRQLPFEPTGSTARLGALTVGVDGEWATITGASADPAELVQLAWWATRRGARSLQVRSAGVSGLGGLGFVELRG